MLLDAIPCNDDGADTADSQMAVLGFRKQAIDFLERAVSARANSDSLEAERKRYSSSQDRGSYRG